MCIPLCCAQVSAISKPVIIRSDSEGMLERHPEFLGRFVFTQVLVPSREQVAEYRSLKRELDETVGRINGRFSDQGWSPARLRHSSNVVRDRAGSRSTKWEPTFASCERVFKRSDDGRV